jgi:FkbM family methyltransferase
MEGIFRKKICNKVVNKLSNIGNSLIMRIKNLIIIFFYEAILNSYSQYHEDRVINKLLKKKQIGTYIDVGANDPIHFNNTKYFYDKGWHGINIEPNSILFKKILKRRTRDINLNIGVGEKRGELIFYEISADTLSTFSEEMAKKSIEEGHKLISSHTVKVLTLADIFEEYLANLAIDFMSIDVEGLDLEVLKSNNWLKYRPTVVMVEINRDGEKIIDFLECQGYELKHNNLTNAIFKSIR